MNDRNQPPRRFALGQIVISPNALEHLDTDDACTCLRRHASGDWGDLPPEDIQENELSLKEGFRLFSAYTDRHATRFYIITEADRSATTLLLPEDY